MKEVQRGEKKNGNRLFLAHGGEQKVYRTDKTNDTMMNMEEKMNEIIEIHGNSEYPVSGRELHEQLGIETPYHKWFPRMCEYGFDSEKDYQQVLDKNVQNPMGGRPATDHMLTLSMAKELCMLQRTEKGREVRRYLIRVEEAWNSPDAIMARALNIANERVKHLTGRVEHLEEKIEADAPKVLFADSVAASRSEILVGELAKMMKQNGLAIGQNRLFEILRRDGYLVSRRGTDWNMPTQRSMELGVMRIKETSVTHADGHVTVSRTPKITGKGQVYFINRYQGRMGVQK